jgi:HAD superfamily hydrolase (TIGR01484 family)
VLTDIDGTLTTHGRLPAVAYGALERLRAAGLIVVPVTGRPAGWCDHVARLWPVDGVVGENGAFSFRYDTEARRMLRDYTQDAEMRTVNTARLFAIARDVLAKFPGAAIASDQAYREIDVAVDFCEDVPALPLSVAQGVKEMFEAAGATAKISSIHVNAWFGTHDKLTMARRFLSESFGIADPAEVAYAGDSPNDAPMFAAFPLSVGVANILPLKHLVDPLPAYVTKAEGGEGFAELAEAVLGARA